ncbi:MULTISPECIES: DinB family protein [Aequorivita]|uniref:DinB family protein n=1 Tax=Aequorivita iocasae TaxID=2803865 RepID=A0ABX7DMP2_9FLAO|nr:MULTISPECIES: DinB family protein [Aequorivita]QQX75268.1 DinB family protein [Aequorivita iocasae]UCA54716.1 DinB family protein [Aequorivita sp. F7]
MTQSELIILNFSEIRRRSIKLWNGLPESHYHWKPDENAMTAIEMVRHVLEADYGWNIIINQGDMKNYKTPWKNRPYVSVTDELEFANPYRDTFLESIRKFSDTDLNKTEIVHPGNGDKKILAKYLLRIGYHESVHAGQFLSYLRAMKLERPEIWD